MRRNTSLLLALLAFVGCGDPAPFAPVGIDDPEPRPDAGMTEDEPDAAAPMEDGGPPITTVTTFDPRLVYLNGTFDEGFCGSIAYEDFDPATRALAGGHCHDDGHVVATDGRLVYVDGDGDVRVFVADPWSVDASGDVDDPGDPLANDPVISTPACDRTGLLRIDPVSGRVLYSCTSSLSGLEIRIFDEDGSERSLPADVSNMWPGHGHDLVVGQRSDLFVATGTDQIPVDVSALPDNVSIGHHARSVRSHDDAFHVLYADEIDEELHLARVTFDGGATLVGTYPPPPDGATWNDWSCQLDAEDRAFCTGSRGGDDVVLRFSIGESAGTIVHDEADDPRVKLHGSRLFTGP